MAFSSSKFALVIMKPSNTNISQAVGFLNKMAFEVDLNSIIPPTTGPLTETNKSIPSTAKFDIMNRKWHS